MLIDFLPVLRKVIHFQENPLFSLAIRHKTHSLLPSRSLRPSYLFSKRFSMTTQHPDITFYTFGTPNGQKVSITLEELGIPYKIYPVALDKNEQKEPWFLKINPNGRIPAIVDHSRNDFKVFETGAIMRYLCEHYDKEGKFLPNDADLRCEVDQWLMFQMSGIGPMQGQADHFIRYAKEKIPYAIKRYVIETRLEGRQYLVGDSLTIADIANFTWIAHHALIGITLDEYPNIAAWLDRMYAREAVKRGLEVPEKSKLLEEGRDPKKAEEIATEVRKWIEKAGAKL
ncbi:4725_t:CDS:2 [Ambispora gerdemannii]|uniref:4725_t:CDS:1 n=1 Tax=Ambispora gerdemannii TaxID=144530 RepID=A0A9N8V0S9_9GLOM|nr:4725_t:CDS:2 [Ambispora gerdemannii]